MNPWLFVSLPATAALLGASGLALLRKGPPAGRTALGLAFLAMALPVGYVGAALWQPDSALTTALAAGANVGLLAFPTLWLTVAFRFGGEGRGLARYGWPVVTIAGLASLLLYVAGACGPDAARVDLLSENPVFESRSLPNRGLLGMLLLTGAAGVVLYQTSHESARRAGKVVLRRAAAGFLLTSLGMFLVAGQTLLYGGAAVHVLSLATIGALPAALASIPALLERKSDAVVLSERSRCGVSSGMLMGLGLFLIALAALGEAIERLAPAGRLLWYHWGGTILVGGFASIWLVPGLRARMRGWFRVSALPTQYEWEWRLLLGLARSTPTKAPALLSAASVFQPSLGRSATALWIRQDDPPGYAPWSSSGVTLPFFPVESPIPACLQSGTRVLDFTEPPNRLGLVAAYVENLELVERQGYQLFMALTSGPDLFGILAFAPRERLSHGDPALALELAAGSASVAVWGALLAAAPANAPISGEGWMQAAELLHRVASNSRIVIPDRRVGEELATWATISAEVCTERAGAAVGRSVRAPRREGTPPGGQTTVRP